MQKTTVAASFIDIVLKHMRHEPHTVEKLLSRSNIQSWANPSKRIEGRAFADLLRNAMTEMDDEFLGYGIAPVKVGSWHSAAQLAVGAKTLHEAMKRLTRFYRNSAIGVEPVIAMCNEGPCLSIHLPDKYSKFESYLFESLLFYIYRFANWLTGEVLPLVRVEFNFKRPCHAKEHIRFFLTRHIEYDKDISQIVFLPGTFERRIVQNESHLQAFLGHANLAMVEQHNVGCCWKLRVETLLSQLLKSRSESAIAEVAAKLGVHSHTLRKYLRAEETDFTAIKTQLRLDIASDLLLNSNTKVEQIAEMIGFSEASVFIRAFKKWTGNTPTQFRRKR